MPKLKELSTGMIHDSFYRMDSRYAMPVIVPQIGCKSGWTDQMDVQEVCLDTASTCLNCSPKETKKPVIPADLKAPTNSIIKEGTDKEICADCHAPKDNSYCACRCDDENN